MNKLQHTPGPWEWCETKTGLYGPDYPIIDTDRDWGMFLHPTNLEANAHLIAAAPDMLEALIAQERADWARRNYESISCDPLHPDRKALSLEMIQTMSYAATLRKEAIAKAKP